MNSIDFQQLLRDEKKRARNNKQVKSNETKQINNDTATTTSIQSLLPPWNAGNELGSSTWNKQQTLLNGPLKSIYYQPNAISNAMAKHLQDWLEALPEGDSGLEEWKSMTYGKRKVCMFGERTHTLPPPLSLLAQHLVDQNIFTSQRPPNHVLINAYQPTQGILPHTDGPLYAPQTATLSLGSDVVLEFTPRLQTHEIGTTHSHNNTTTVWLQANSWIVFGDEAYTDHCHGIVPNVTHDTLQDHCLNAPTVGRRQVIPRGYRLSLTFRHKYTKETKPDSR